MSDKRAELIEKMAVAVMREAKLLNNEQVQRDFDSGHIDPTRVWARKYATAALAAIEEQNAVVIRGEMVFCDCMKDRGEGDGWFMKPAYKVQK